MKIIVDIIGSFINYIKGIFIPCGCICTIEEINTLKKIVVIKSKWISAPIKLSFEEIIHDNLILSNLSSQHASWLGYYYGMNRKYYTDRKYNNASCLNFTFRETSTKYKLISQDRLGKISYLNNITGQMQSSSVISILSTSNIIKNFDPIEACYLGMLWGIHISKRNENTHLPIVSNAILKLVK